MLKGYGARTHQGPCLEVNEDAVEADPAAGLFVLVDGVGGGGVGDRAAALIAAGVRKAYAGFREDPDSTLPFFYGARYLLETNALVNAVLRANASAMEANAARPLPARGGGSVAAACVAGRVLGVVAAGSCGAWLARGGRLSPLAAPDGGGEAAAGGLGFFEEPCLAIREVRTRPGDAVLLMSDGVFARPGDRDLLRVLGSGAGADPDAVIGELFDLANGLGNLDNQSCVLLSF